MLTRTNYYSKQRAIAEPRCGPAAQRVHLSVSIQVCSWVASGVHDIRVVPLLVTPMVGGEVRHELVYRFRGSRYCGWWWWWWVTIASWNLRMSRMRMDFPLPGSGSCQRDASDTVDAPTTKQIHLHHAQLHDPNNITNYS